MAKCSQPLDDAPGVRAAIDQVAEKNNQILTCRPAGQIGIDDVEKPVEQVQATVRLLFDEFDRQGTLHGLLRYLVHHNIRIPVRPGSGPNRGALEWRRPNRETLQNLMHHPCYAGAYRYGHRPTDPRRKQPGRPGAGKLIRRPEDCLVLIRDRLPAYITWARFEANQDRLAANRARYELAQIQKKLPAEVAAAAGPNVQWLTPDAFAATGEPAVPATPATARSASATSLAPNSASDLEWYKPWTWF